MGTRKLAVWAVRCVQSKPIIMLVLLVVLLIIFVPVTVLKLSTYSVSAPDPFACGSDGVCFCDKAKDCIKRESE